MTTAYINSSSLTDWQRTLTRPNRDIETPCAGVLAKIDTVLAENPDRVPLREFVELLEGIGQSCRSSSLAWAAGQAVELKPRTVKVYDIKVVALKYPELTLDVQCGGGTYIRSLGRDIGLALQTSAVMSALTRSEVGCFDLSAAVDPAVLQTREAIKQHLLPPLMAVAT